MCRPEGVLASCVDQRVMLQVSSLITAFGQEFYLEPTRGLFGDLIKLSAMKLEAFLMKL